ncbi:unnamed protein product [Sphagnum compactum]
MHINDFQQDIPASSQAYAIIGELEEDLIERFNILFSPGVKGFDPVYLIGCLLDVNTRMLLSPAERQLAIEHLSEAFMKQRRSEVATSPPVTQSSGNLAMVLDLMEKLDGPPKLVEKELDPITMLLSSSWL